MADLLVRNVSDVAKERLADRARRNGRSQGAEARALLESALQDSEPDWVQLLRDASRFGGGYNLELPLRRPARELDTSEWL